MEDLGSTNGVFHNEKKVMKAGLKNYVTQLNRLLFRSEKCTMPASGMPTCI